MADFREHIIEHKHPINQADRNRNNGHKSIVLWYTGLSGSGKSTLAGALETYFHKKKYSTYILDGDNIRKGLNSDLDFSDSGRKENIRRIAEVSKLFVDAGNIVSTAFISPFREDRESAKKIVGEENFIEVYVDCPLEVCEERDVKGLYKKARAGEIPFFTGISSPFEIPENPDVRVDTANNSLNDCLNQLIEEIEPRIKL